VSVSAVLVTISTYPRKKPSDAFCGQAELMVRGRGFDWGLNSYNFVGHLVAPSVRLYFHSKNTAVPSVAHMFAEIANWYRQ
jgi:hypothetical protein